MFQTLAKVAEDAYASHIPEKYIDVSIKASFCSNCLGIHCGDVTPTKQLTLRFLTWKIGTPFKQSIWIIKYKMHDNIYTIEAYCKTPVNSLMERVFGLIGCHYILLLAPLGSLMPQEFSTYRN